MLLCELFCCVLSCLLPRLFSGLILHPPLWSRVSFAGSANETFIFIVLVQQLLLTYSLFLCWTFGLCDFPLLFRVAITQSNVKNTFRELFFCAIFGVEILFSYCNLILLLFYYRAGVCVNCGRNWYKQSSWNWKVQSRGKAKSNCNFQSRDLYCFIQ